MKQFVKVGQTDYTVLVLFRDSTTGLAKTGLTGASAGMNAAYTRVETDNDVTIAEHATLHALATPALTDVHLDWGFIEVDATHAPGLYRLDIPDEAFATGAWSVVVSLVCTGCDTVHLEFMLIPEAPYTGTYIAPTQGSPTFAAFSVTGQLDAGTLVVDGAASTGGTTTLNALTVTGTTTHTGTTVHTGNVSFADGITIPAPSTGNRPGVSVTGFGTGAGVAITGGATGPGVVTTGGGNDAAADGVRIVAGGANASGLEVDRLNVTGTTALTGAISTGALTSASITSSGAIAGTLANDIITAASINTGAITDDAFAANAIVAATLNADCITAAKIANGAIDFATFAADCKTGTGLKANVESISANAITAASINDAAIDNATFAADVGSTAYATNVIALAVFKALDAAITDGVSLTAGGLLEKVRKLTWVIGNKAVVTDLNGNTVIYKDDNATAAYTVNAMLTDDSTTTTRLRAA